MSTDYARFSGQCNTRNNGHTLKRAAVLSTGLMKEPWRIRLLDAADASGWSDSYISKKAGLGRNAFNELRTTSKEPGVERVIKFAEALDLSLSYVFLGREASREEDEFLDLLKDASKEQKAGLRLLLAGRKRPAEDAR